MGILQNLFKCQSVCIFLVPQACVESNLVVGKDFKIKSYFLFQENLTHFYDLRQLRLN